MPQSKRLARSYTISEVRSTLTTAATWGTLGLLKPWKGANLVLGTHVDNGIISRTYRSVALHPRSTARGSRPFIGDEGAPGYINFFEAKKENPDAPISEKGRYELYVNNGELESGQNASFFFGESMKMNRLFSKYADEMKAVLSLAVNDRGKSTLVVYVERWFDYLIVSVVRKSEQRNRGHEILVDDACFYLHPKAPHYLGELHLLTLHPRDSYVKKEYLEDFLSRADDYR